MKEQDNENNGMDTERASIRKNDNSVNSFSDCLKYVARRSKAGFGRVHDELLRIRFEYRSTDPKSPNKNKVKNKWIQIKSAVVQSSSALNPDTGGFSSYIPETEEDEGIYTDIANNDSVVSYEKTDQSFDNTQGLQSVGQIRTESKALDFDKFEFKDLPGTGHEYKVLVVDTNANNKPSVRERNTQSNKTTSTQLVSQHDKCVYDIPRNASDDLYSTPIKSKSSGLPEEDNEHIDMEHNETDEFVNCKQDINGQDVCHADYENCRQKIKPKIKPRNSTKGKVRVKTEDVHRLKQEPDNNNDLVRPTKELFYSFTVEEVVECLNVCALSQLANICQREKLDGEFFKTITKDDLKNEPFVMNWFYISKLFRVIGGWRPKQTS